MTPTRTHSEVIEARFLIPGDYLVSWDATVGTVWRGEEGDPESDLNPHGVFPDHIYVWYLPFNSKRHEFTVFSVYSPVLIRREHHDDDPFQVDGAKHTPPF